MGKIPQHIRAGARRRVAIARATGEAHADPHAMRHELLALTAHRRAVVARDRSRPPGRGPTPSARRVIDTVQPLLTPYYPSQLFQALTDGPLLIALMFIVWWKPRRVGVPASWFLLGYGVMRIASEGLRQPDEGVAQLAGLSRGQVLSVAMVVIGATLLIWRAKRTNAPKHGGLGVVAAPE